MVISDPQQPPVRAALVAVQLSGASDRAFQASLAELARLAKTLGLTVAGTVTQRRSALHRATVL
ncbi:MAG TPA: GTPase HflX, partial [Polyangia bacterium]|nr:GTPase HflX [Polyangia bacterium]